MSCYELLAGHVVAVADWPKQRMVDVVVVDEGACGQRDQYARGCA